MLYSSSDFDNGLERYEISRCMQCRLVNTMGVSEEDLSLAYSVKYYGSGTEKFTSIIESLIKIGDQKRARNILQQWSGGGLGTKKPSVLDIGCGRGNLLTAFQSMQATVLGLERKEFPIADVEKEFIHYASLSDPAYSDYKFDIVIIWHVLEHLDAQDALIEEVCTHMKSNGLLVIAVPHYGSYQQRLFGASWFHLDLPRHLVHIEKTWLLERLQRIGAADIRVSTFDFNQQLYGFIQSTLNRVFPNHPNDLYALLKSGSRTKHLYRLGFWLISAAVLLPFALLEAVISVSMGKGATLICHARINPSNDQ